MSSLLNKKTYTFALVIVALCLMLFGIFYYAFYLLIPNAVIVPNVPNRTDLGSLISQYFVSQHPEIKEILSLPVYGHVYPGSKVTDVNENVYSPHNWGGVLPGSITIGLQQVPFSDNSLDNTYVPDDLFTIDSGDIVSKNTFIQNIHYKSIRELVAWYNHYLTMNGWIPIYDVDDVSGNVGSGMASYDSNLFDIAYYNKGNNKDYIKLNFQTSCSYNSFDTGRLCYGISYNQILQGNNDRVVYANYPLNPLLNSQNLYSKGVTNIYGTNDTLSDIDSWYLSEAKQTSGMWENYNTSFYDVNYNYETDFYGNYKNNYSLVIVKILNKDYIEHNYTQLGSYLKKYKNIYEVESFTRS